MTLLDTLLHEYGWTQEYALDCSLARAFAFYAAISARYGHDASGPTYEEQGMLDAINAAKTSQEETWAA